MMSHLDASHSVIDLMERTSMRHQVLTRFTPLSKCDHEEAAVRRHQPSEIVSPITRSCERTLRHIERRPRCERWFMG